jgi:HSP20 family molecular chaperone IbpA
MFVKTDENVKSEKTKIDVKIILVIILLVVLCAIQFSQGKKIDRLYKYVNGVQMQYMQDFRPLVENGKVPENEPKESVRHRFFDSLSQEMKKIDIARKRIQNEMDEYFNGSVDANNDIMPINDSNRLNKPGYEDTGINLKIDEEYKKDKNSYTLNIYLPKDFSEKDVDVSIDDNLLYLKISKNETLNKKGEEFESSFSSMKVMALPKTKAQTKDIKKTFKNGKLTIMVPIK